LLEVKSTLVAALSKERKRGFADMFAQASIEAASISSRAATVAGASPGATEVTPEGALSSGDGAAAGLCHLGGDGVQGNLVVVLAAVVFAFGSFAPISAG